MQNSTLKNILVIDNHDSFVYNLVQILRENEHCQFDIVQNDRIDFSSLDRYDKLLLSPGPAFLPKPEISSPSSSIAKRPMIFSVYASVIKPLPKPSVPAYNN